MGIGPGGGPCGVVGSTRTDGAEKKNKFYIKNWFSMLFAETLASKILSLKNIMLKTTLKHT